MVLTCPKCQARLHVDDAKTPAAPFTVKCPKCQTSVSGQPQSCATGDSPAAPSPVTENPPPENMPFERPSSAAPFKPNSEGLATESGPAGLNDIAKLLAEALSHTGDSSRGRKRPAWDKRKVLICVTPAHQEVIAHLLAGNDYSVFVAENTAQALGRMREERMDVLVLDAGFDPQEQGVAFMTREVRLMRPSERRRLFLAYITSGVRTLDLHAAFLHNVNLVVNPSDIEQLAEALDISMRHFNELYRDFNLALGVTPL
jgi:predicted Zn finger-like uncharacterized protein